MEVWSGSYENLRVFSAMAFAHFKKDKLEAHAKNVSSYDT